MAFSFHRGHLPAAAHGFTFMRQYPSGDHGGNEVCMRSCRSRAIDLHRFWVGLITSTNNVGQISRIAKESYKIATKVAYGNGRLRGTPKGATELPGSEISFPMATPQAKVIAARRVYLAAVRLADTLGRSFCAEPRNHFTDSS